MIKDIKRMKNERGFTLIELLVVIVILGILAAVVVFAVGGLTDKGNTSACKIDTRTLRTAEEAYSAKNGTYAPQSAMTGAPDQFLSEASKLHGVRAVAAPAAPATDDEVGNPPSTDYEIYITAEGVDKKCGDTAGDVVDGTNTF